MGNSKPVVYANTEDGAYELFLAGNWEVNELMKAEASIFLDQVENKLKLL